MCKKCQSRLPVKYWLHIADSWTKKEKMEMVEYLNESQR